MNLSNRAILTPFIHEGRVDYAALQAKLDLASLLDDVAMRDLSGAGRDEQLAFYLNAYNLQILQQVAERLNNNPDWPGPLSTWSKIRFFMLTRHVVAGRRMSFHQLENCVLRRRFQDARIHFAINCGSASCPHLPSFLFVADELHEDLERLTTQFICSDEVQYDSAANVLSVSPIFKWYRRDFLPSIPAFIARYRHVPPDARVTFRAYDWRVNQLQTLRQSIPTPLN